jgi:predicted dithiol-disulfide oxidoreductase (DUF899 family)
LRRKAHGGPVADYELSGWDGPVSLSELFGDRDQLILIHNMGFTCPYCTMWADGFNGLLPHIEERAAFTLASPDAVEQQKKGAAKRRWQFRMVSTRGSSFSKDLGFEDEGSPTPGVSTFVRGPDGTIRRYAAASFGPGDRFCSVWSFVDLLPEAEAG